jgi:L-2-hydroxycarboxylate dehydrogenase (NAD+)
MSSGLFAEGRSQKENLKAVMDDILGHGNENALWPGQIEARAASQTADAGGLLFTAAELNSFAEIGKECGLSPWDTASLETYTG